MRRVALIAALILCGGMWVEPIVSDAGDTLAPPSTSPVTQPSTAPSQPPFRTLRGQENFWRIAEDHAGVWWLLDPSGQAEFLNTVTTVQPYQLARDPQGPSFVSRDWDGGLGDEGNLEQWARHTLDRIRHVGFKGLGAWCHPVFHQHDVPFTRDLNLWKWMKGDARRRFYSPDWPTLAEQAIRVQVEPLKSNPHLIGYYVDNELDWGDSGSGPRIYFDHLPPDDPNRRQVLAVIQSIWTTVDSFKQDWAAEISDWSELDHWQTLPNEQPAAYGRLFSAWLSHLAEDYFRLTTGLIRQYDPNHLILGVRFKGYAPLEVVRASRNYTDAQSLNYYVSDGRLDLDMFRMMHEQSGQPIIVSEYSFHALDGRSGNRNTVGFSAQVLDQQARADGYRLFTQRMARVPYIIAAEWFQWSDEPPSGRSHDGEDVNFGVVDVDDRPYELLAQAIRETTPALNSLHETSHSDEQADVFRESFANKPVARVPYLDKPIRLNGELSDWPAQAKLEGVRHSQAIGLERSPLPLPNVFIGWTDEGLYLGMEVFDNDIHSASPKAWWWTRDHVEFWVSTRPVPSDQTGFNVYSHQFFFVPIDFPADTGIAGAVGQWHRSGDALDDHLIPHPDVRHNTRILPDRYVVEMFVPAKALHGYDPRNQPALAFNLYVRNFQHAIDYFWSAPKEVLTQHRPNTWGPMYLEAPIPVTAQSMADAPEPMPQ